MRLYPVEQCRIEGTTPLMIAAHAEHADVAALLIGREGGAAVDARSDRVTALMLACFFEHATASVLLKAGADRNAPQHGSTALMFACQFGHKRGTRCCRQTPRRIR